MNQSPSHNTDALASLCPPCPNKPRSEARALQSHVRLDALLRPRPCRAPHLSPLLGPDPYMAVVPLLRAQGACEGPGGRPSTCAGMPPSVRAWMMPTWAQPLRQQEDGAGSQRHRAARTPGTAVPFHPTPQCTRHGERGKDANSEREWDALERQPALSLLHPLASGRL